MIVLREETPAGVLVKVHFRASEGESQVDFKAAVKAWETANGIVSNWEQFFDQCDSMETGRIVLLAP